MRQRDFERMWKKMPAFSLGLCGVMLILTGVFMLCFNVDNMNGVGILFVTVGFILFLSGIIWGIIKNKQRQEIKKNLVNSNIEQVDQMSGIEFENFLDSIFTFHGYEVKYTKASGDFGVDLILQRNSEKVIVQAKRYSKKVSVSAIQEISAARDYYSIHTAWVVTNNYFTNPAIKLAQSNGIKLIDRESLAILMNEAKIKKEHSEHGNRSYQKAS